MLVAKEGHVEAFADEVKELFRGRVARVILYGSYARDEELPGSDIDLAIIVSEKRSDDRKRAQELAERWIQETGLRFSPRVFEEDDFERKAREGYSFHKNVDEEGVEI